MPGRIPPGTHRRSVKRLYRVVNDPPLVISHIVDDDVPAVVNLWRACDLVRPWDDPLVDILDASDNIASTILVGKTAPRDHGDAGGAGGGEMVRVGVDLGTPDDSGALESLEGSGGSGDWAAEARTGRPARLPAGRPAGSAVVSSTGPSTGPSTLVQVGGIQTLPALAPSSAGGGVRVADLSISGSRVDGARVDRVRWAADQEFHHDMRGIDASTGGVPESTSADLDTADDADPQHTILAEPGVVVATAMAGFDGHRGWVYYLAVHPDLTDPAYAQVMVDTAEQWLGEAGARKVQVQVRYADAPRRDQLTDMGFVDTGYAVFGRWIGEK